jgi:hypothetical protein
MDGYPLPRWRQFVTRPRQQQDPVVVGDPPPQDRLEHVVDHSLVGLRHGPDVQPLDQATLAEVHVLVAAKVLLDRDFEPGHGRDQHEAVEVEAAVAEDKRRGSGNPLIDPQVGCPDKDRELVGRRCPRLAVRPGHERRIDPMELVVHRPNDGAARAGKLTERESHEVAGPPAVHPVDDQLGVAIHQLPSGGINSADPIVLMDSRLGFGRLSRLISLGLVMVGSVSVDLVLVGLGLV